MIYRFWPRRTPSPLREPAFAVLMAYQCFLVAIMVFGADPMQPSLAIPRDGDGLSPLLQHPAMLLHPPVVFLGYAGCAIPFALALAALLSGRLDAAWIREARPWAFFAWAVLGIGILLGAYWAYEELGWGGYWNWDPVENGSLIPWLTGTALIHAPHGLSPTCTLEADDPRVWPSPRLRPATSPRFSPAAASSAACTPSANRRSAGCSCC